MGQRSVLDHRLACGSRCLGRDWISLARCRLDLDARDYSQPGVDNDAPERRTGRPMAVDADSFGDSQRAVRPGGVRRVTLPSEGITPSHSRQCGESSRGARAKRQRVILTKSAAGRAAECSCLLIVYPVRSNRAVIQAARDYTVPIVQARSLAQPVLLQAL
jgi:hypothetical protein